MTPMKKQKILVTCNMETQFHNFVIPISNFIGTRHAIEGEGKIFDVFTQAVVEPDENVIENPWLKSRSRRNPDMTALVLDKHLHVFQHNGMNEEVFSIRFGSVIDEFEW